MPFDSQGNFTRVMNWQEDAANSIPILASRHDDEDDNFANGFNETMCRDGRTAMTGQLKMNNNKIVNVANATASGDAVNKGQLDSVQTTLQTNINAKANNNNVVKLTGNQTKAGTLTLSSSPILPTPSASDNSQKGATTAFVKTAINNLLASITPDWSNAQTISFPYTATAGGWVVIQISKNNNNAYIKIDDVAVGRTMGSSGDWVDSTSVQLPIASGSKVTIEGSPTIVTSLFIPFS